ncbi:contractile injection system tape measure protein [Tenacibaculum agarivorans]|uniref:contractile injection system tape measure protein n=1 Tax=Tenacibaculum agarivorans TaxID=1908389 RepID=UPI00094BA926|nr:contractile injection system tape measure protein [Tenacibaculum agarivorans]
MFNSSTNHIINRQVVEIHLNKEANTFELQHKVADLCKENLAKIIDTSLAMFFESTTSHIQIEKLELDLGEVNFEDIEEKFTSILYQKLSEISEPNEYEIVEGSGRVLEKTPFKIVTYFLANGMLPWWVDNSKTYVIAQLNILLENPSDDVKKMLSQLHTESKLMKRYVNTFTETQLLETTKLLTNLDHKSILEIKTAIKVAVTKRTTNELPEFLFTKLFYSAIFQIENITLNIKELRNNILKKIYQELGVNVEEKNEDDVQKVLQKIHSWVVHYKTKHKNNAAWQYVFEYIHQIITKYSANQLSITLLKELVEVLDDLALKEKNIPNDTDPNNIELQEQITSTVLLPITKCVMQFGKIKKDTKGITASSVFQEEIEAFETTDFLSIENAGLVLLWPFLQRFFENLELLENKVFNTEEAKEKAVSVLQYLCTEEEVLVFEGLLPLAKILCGIAIDQPMEIFPLSATEKEIANHLLMAVIAQGKSWGNISSKGFRVSYIQRQASLRTRDDHWLLQVKKETYDVVLQKLPWSFTTIKLPWMEKLLMVEWL